jgi:hypothetical protein
MVAKSKPKTKTQTRTPPKPKSSSFHGTTKSSASPPGKSLIQDIRQKLQSAYSLAADSGGTSVVNHEDAEQEEEEEEPDVGHAVQDCQDVGPPVAADNGDHQDDRSEGHDSSDIGQEEAVDVEARPPSSRPSAATDDPSVSLSSSSGGNVSAGSDIGDTSILGTNHHDNETHDHHDDQEEALFSLNMNLNYPTPSAPPMLHSPLPWSIAEADIDLRHDSDVT